MANFVTLTRQGGRERVIVNLSTMAYAVPWHGGTEIAFPGGEGARYMHVRETIEEIGRMAGITDQTRKSLPAPARAPIIQADPTMPERLPIAALRAMSG